MSGLAGQPAGGSWPNFNLINFLEGCYSSFETHLANHHKLYFYWKLFRVLQFSASYPTAKWIFSKMSLESNIIWPDLVETQFFSGLMIPQARLYVVIFSVLNQEQVKGKPVSKSQNCSSLFPLFYLLFFVLASRQPSKAFRRSTRSPALKRPKVWTASTRGCHHGGMRCPPTLASTRSTRRCPRRPTAPTPRGAPVGAATSSEEGRAQSRCGLPPKRRG